MSDTDGVPCWLDKDKEDSSLNFPDGDCCKLVESDVRGELYCSLLAQNLTCLNGLPDCS